MDRNSEQNDGRNNWPVIRSERIGRVVTVSWSSIVIQQLADQGLYIIFQMDWKRVRRPITKYTFPFLQSLLQVKNIASGKKLQRLSWKHQ